MRPLAAAVSLLVVIAGGVSCGTSGQKNSIDDGSRAALKQGRLDRKLVRLRKALKHELAARRRQRAAQQKHLRSHPRPNGRSNNGFVALEHEMPGRAGVTIGAPGSSRFFSAGSLQTGSAWSTIKVPIALSVLQGAGGPSGLSPVQADEIRRALTLSDNEAAAALFDGLVRVHGGLEGAATAVESVLREAGDSTTQVSTIGRDGFSPYGQTEWSLALQHRFLSAFVAGCVGTRPSRDYVLSLMGQVSSDTWGLGSTGLPARWKGGWGPGTDGRYLARQMGILRIDGRDVIVTLAVVPDDGSFTTAQQMATEIAAWLAEYGALKNTSSTDC